MRSVEPHDPQFSIRRYPPDTWTGAIIYHVAQCAAQFWISPRQEMNSRASKIHATSP